MLNILRGKKHSCKIFNILRNKIKTLSLWKSVSHDDHCKYMYSHTAWTKRIKLSFFCRLPKFTFPFLSYRSLYRYVYKQILS